MANEQQYLQSVNRLSPSLSLPINISKIVQKIKTKHMQSQNDFVSYFGNLWISLLYIFYSCSNHFQSIPHLTLVIHIRTYVLCMYVVKQIHGSTTGRTLLNDLNGTRLPSLSLWQHFYQHFLPTGRRKEEGEGARRMERRTTGYENKTRSSCKQNMLVGQKVQCVSVSVSAFK